MIEPLGMPASWAPEACTLPTMEQPLRLAEFDEVFTTSVRAVERVDTGRVRLQLAPETSVAARVADLMVRETACCGFFTFTMTATSGRLALEVTVPQERVNVLEALADRAASLAAAS